MGRGDVALHSAAGMAGERTKLTVTHREQLGSRESRRLRREGLIPGVLYGGSGDPVAICVPERELRRALTGGAGLHAILDVEIDGKGKTHASILKEFQVDPVRGGVTHVDLQEVRLDRTIHASVVVYLVGAEDAPGVREGGVLAQPLREVSVEALPLEVPEHIDVDVSGMELGATLRVADISAPDGVALLDDPETVLATITAATRVAEPEELLEGEEAEAVEGEEPSEAEQPEGGSEAPAEPGADAAGEQGTVEG
jgi:large subunit ribosomal protein L25